VWGVMWMKKNQGFSFWRELWLAPVGIVCSLVGAMVIPISSVAGFFFVAAGMALTFLALLLSGIRVLEGRGEISLEARERLIRCVRVTWIEPLFQTNSKTRRESPAYRPEIVASPLYRPGSTAPAVSLSLEPETGSRKSPSRLFRESGRELLLLGAPGSGKTFFLAELAEALLPKVGESREPIPVVFPLRSWDPARPLLSWMAEELADRYKQRRGTARVWLSRGLICPLFDGIEDLPASRRDECVQQINAHRKVFSQGLAVSCSPDAYSQLTEGLAFSSDPLVILPIDEKRARNFLLAQGTFPDHGSFVQDSPLVQERSLTPLVRVFDSSPGLRKALGTSFMLSLAIEASRRVDLLTLFSPTSTSEECCSILLDAHIDYLLQQTLHGQIPSPGEQEATLRWLGWVSKGMRARKKSFFHLDDIDDKRFSLKDRLWARVLHFGIALGVCGLLAGLLVGASGTFFARIAGSFSSGAPVEFAIEGLAEGMRESSPYLGIVAWLSGGWKTGLSIGLSAALVAWSMCGVRHGKTRLLGARWSFRPDMGRFFLAFLSGMRAGVIAGMVSAIALIVAVMFQVDMNQDIFQTLSRNLFSWIGVSVLGGFAVGAFFRLIHIADTDKDGSSFLSFQDRLLWNGLLVCSLVFLATTLMGLLVGRGTDGLAVGFVTGAVIAPVLGWKYGIGPYAWHEILCFFLRRKESIPPRLPAFLDMAAQHGLLYKIGESYRFPHTLLQDQIVLRAADLLPPETTSPASSTGQAAVPVGQGGRTPRRSFASLASLGSVFRSASSRVAPFLLSIGAFGFFFVGNPFDDLFIAAMLHDHALVEYRAGNYADSESLAEQSLLLTSQVYSSTHPDTLSMLGVYGAAKFSLGNQDKAAELFSQALEMAELTLGPTHPATAVPLNALGILETERGNWKQARVLFSRALAVSEAAYGTVHQNVAVLLCNIGSLEESLGHQPQARFFYEEAFRILEELRGPGHPDIARLFVNLGGVEQSLGDNVHALDFYERALDIFEKNFDVRHREIREVLSLLGNTESALGNKQEALVYYRRALHSYQNSSEGTDPIGFGTTLYNFGLSELSFGSYEHARDLLESAQGVLEEAYGPVHPGVAAALNALGSTEGALGNWNAARDLHREALDIFATVYAGESHHEVARTLYNLGLAEWFLGNREDSQALYTWALAIFRVSYDDAPHPDIGETLLGLGFVEAGSENWHHARRFFREALEIFETGLPSGHPNIARTLNALGDVERALGNNRHARRLYRDALKIYEQALDEMHPDIARTLVRLGLTEWSLGMWGQARELIVQALEIFETTLGPAHPETRQARELLFSLDPGAHPDIDFFFDLDGLQDMDILGEEDEMSEDGTGKDWDNEVGEKVGLAREKEEADAHKDRRKTPATKRVPRGRHPGVSNL